jgi:hypothetical protein
VKLGPAPVNKRHPLMSYNSTEAPASALPWTCKAPAAFSAAVSSVTAAVAAQGIPAANSARASPNRVRGFDDEASYFSSQRLLMSSCRVR